MTEPTDFDYAAMFAAGAESVLPRTVLEKDAETFVCGLCKQAIYGGGYDDESTFWSRNKNWLLPLIVGSAAWYAGASGERNGRRDRSYLANTVGNIWSRAKALFGIDARQPVTDALTERMGNIDGDY